MLLWLSDIYDCISLWSPCIFAKEESLAKGLVENSKLPKSAQPVREGKRQRQEREKKKQKMSRRRLQMRLVSIRGSMEMEETILCERMISVRRQTQEDRLLEEIPSCVGRIQNGQDRRCSLEVAGNTVPCFLTTVPTPPSFGENKTPSES